MKKEKTLSDNEILVNVMSALGIGVKDFAKKLDVADSTIYAVKQGTNNLSENLINKIIYAYPQINYVYLRTGNGEVLRDNIQQVMQKNILVTRNKEISLIAEKIDLLEIRIISMEQKIKELINILTEQKK